jgi:hypothetical protein
MCSVELVQVQLQHDEAYAYGQEYADDKKVLRSKLLRPGQTPWEAMCSLYPFCNMANKENPSFSPVRYAPPCAEILVLYSVWDAPGPVRWYTDQDEADDAQEDDRFQIVTLWDCEEDDGQLHKENLQQGCPWLFNVLCADETNTCRLCADDSIEIRTIKRQRPPQPRLPQPFDLRGLRACLHTL